MGYEFVKKLSAGYNVSTKRYSLFVGVYLIMIFVGLGNPIAMYLLIPISNLIQYDLCTETFLMINQITLIFNYLWPLWNGLVILRLIQYFSSEHT